MEEKVLVLREEFLCVDEEFKDKLNDLALEINKLDTEFLATVTLLSKLPYELAMVVVDNIKYDKEGYLGVLNTFYYEDFKEDILAVDEKGVSKFENRLISQKLMNFEDFAVNRLLTIKEIENLIKIFIEENKHDATIEELIKKEKKVKDKNIKILLKAHEFLLDKQNAKINEQIMKKMDKFWLELTLRSIIEKKEEKKLV